MTRIQVAISDRLVVALVKHAPLDGYASVSDFFKVTIENYIADKELEAAKGVDPLDSPYRMPEPLVLEFDDETVVCPSIHVIPEDNTDVQFYDVDLPESVIEACTELAVSDGYVSLSEFLRGRVYEYGNAKRLELLANIGSRMFPNN